MSRYALIDPVLSQWAEAHSVSWLTEYQDTEVRTLYLPVERRDRVQIAVDQPQDGQVAIHIGQNRRGLSRLSRRESLTVPLADLSVGLNDAWLIADGWLAED